MVKGIIFDADGTLLNSMPIWENLGELYLKSMGIEAKQGLGEVLFTMSLPQAAQYLIQEYHLNLTEEEIIDRIAAMHMLTQRERDVFALAYEGKTNPEIAEELFISKHTVKRHMHSIFEKLDVSTRIELVHMVRNQNGPGGL